MTLKATDYQGRRVVILGLGLHEGAVGACRFFADRGADLLVTDLKSEAQLRPSLDALDGIKLQLRLGEHREDDLAAADLIIVNPAVPDTSRYLRFALDRGIPVDTEMNLFFKLCAAPIVGVTGSVGKTTTTSLIAHILHSAGRKVRLGGNIGTSLLPEVDDIAPEEMVVLELSSFHIERLAPTGLAPHVSVVTNIVPNHLDRYPDIDAYAEAKRPIVANQREGDFAILNASDKRVAAWADGCRSKVLWFSVDDHGRDGVFVRDESIHLREGEHVERQCPHCALGLRGTHNLANALAAVAACAVLDCAGNIVEQSFRTFTGREHRIEFVATRNGVDYYDDSKATTPVSATAALQAFDEPIVLIAGGRDKELSYDDFAGEINSRARAAVLIGETAGTLKQLIERQSDDPVPAHIADDLESAVVLAAELALPGDVVLLSPACASFDMFDNAEQRGRHFQEIVKRLS